MDSASFQFLRFWFLVHYPRSPAGARSLVALCFAFFGFFRGPGGSQRLRGRPGIHIPSRDIDFSSKNRFLKNRELYEISIFDINRLLDQKLSTGTSKIGKLLHIAPIDVEFGAARACFVTKQGQE